MLMPKRTKYRKMQKGRIKGNAQRGSRINFGDFAIKTLEPGWITSRQIEACRVAITRKIKRTGKVWIRIFPDKPITKKPAETRMGKGKGSPEYFVAVVKPGRVLFELAGVPEDLAREAMSLAQHKLPVKTKFVVRPDYVQTEAARNFKLPAEPPAPPEEEAPEGEAPEGEAPEGETPEATDETTE